MKERRLIFILMLITVPLAGEFRIYPFHNDFRVSLGTPLFFFFLLWIKKANPLISGILVGTAVFFFRLLYEITSSGIGTWYFALTSNLPVLFYYLTYGAFFSLFQIRRFSHKPLRTGLLSTCIEILASLVEILLRSISLGMVIPGSLLFELAPIAIIRSFFVLGFFSIFTMREAHLLEEQQQQRIESMLVEISDLFVETIQLKKSLDNSEEATRGCYTLYRNLSDTQIPQNLEFAKTALQLAGKVHEIKKDNQRIYAGLSKIISDKSITDYMNVEDLGIAIQKTNQKYARLIGKKVDIKVHFQGEHPSYHTYTVFSILNNLVSNAVESIEEEGNVLISIIRKEDDVEFKVSDSGPGISAKIRHAIFEHGFTTKYDMSGRPSTGIGLSFVRDVTESLGGTITLLDNSTSELTSFLVNLPINALTERG